MSKIRIQILNVTVPASMQQVGGVFCDIGETDLSLSRIAEELNEINEIQYGGVRRFGLPPTAKNLIIFQEFLAVQPHDFDYEPLECRIYVDANILEETKIGASGYNESGNIEAVATKAQDYWIIGAMSLRLPQIPYEDIEFNQVNIETNWSGNYRYADGDIGIHFTPMYFGKPYEVRNMTVEYMRWTYHLLRLYREGFRTFGWCFECEALETLKGRQVAAYLIDPNAYSRADLIEANKATAESGEVNRNSNYRVSTGGLGALFGLLGVLTAKPTYGYHFVILHETVIYDPGSNMNAGRYYGFGTFLFTFTFQYIPKDLRSTIVRVEFYRNNPPPPPSKPTLVFSEDFAPLDDYIGDINQVQEKTFEAEISLQINQSITVSIYAESPKKTIKIKNTFLRVTPITVFPQRGETINPGLYLRNDTLLEALKGWVHIMRGKLDVVAGEKTIRVMPNYETDFFSETLEGYYRDTLIDVTPLQISNGGKIDTPAAKPNRYQLIRFKESTDPWIKRLGLDKLSPLFSKTVDLGEHFKPEYTQHPNPYFEPTLNDWVYDFSPETKESVPVNLPILLDHDPKESDSRVSTDIGPRILFLTEFRPQSWETELGTEAVELQWMKGILTTFNHAYQRNPFLQAAVQDNIVFTDPLMVIENTVYNKFWRSWMFANIMSSKLNLLVLVRGAQYFNWSFRDAYRITFNGKMNICNLLAIDDFLPVSGISTPCIFIPRGVSTAVVQTEEEDLCATYTYELTVTKAGTTYTFTVTTDNPEYPAMGTVEYRYEGSAIWTTAGSLSDPIGAFYVRYTQAGDCPYSIVKFIDPCGNVPVVEIDFEVDESGNYCTTATIGGILLDAITGTALEYDLDDAGMWAAYTPGTEICGTYSKICFRGTVEFDSACEDYVLDETCFEIPPNQDCNQNFPTIEIIHQGLDGFSFDIGGSYLSVLGEFHFWYKKVGEEDHEAKLWTDQAPIFGTDYLVKLFIAWCDDCPPYCSEWTPVSEPAPLMAALSTGEEWDFSKVPQTRKAEIKSLIYSGNRVELMRIHNELELSEHEYCCGADMRKVMNWWAYGLEKGYLND